jgi:hypothetical protein
MSARSYAPNLPTIVFRLRNYCAKHLEPRKTRHLERVPAPASRTWPRSHQVEQQSPSLRNYRARAHTSILLPRAPQRGPDMHMAVHCCMPSWRQRQSWCDHCSHACVTLEVKPAWPSQSHTYTATRLASLASALSSEPAEPPPDNRGRFGCSRMLCTWRRPTALGSRCDDDWDGLHARMWHDVTIHLPDEHTAWVLIPHQAHIFII